MVTGDNEYSAQKVADFLGITDITARASPIQKKLVVKKLQQNKEVVMFVGDGVNDSLVLTQADVGVAINAAANITV